jgi:sugar phosphate isomerase/epimerase
MTGRIGCQTYTWEMLGPRWQGSPDDILDLVAGAGYDGIEFSNAMIGDYLGSPDRLAAALARRGLALAAFAYAAAGFTDPTTYERDLAGAEQALAFARAMGVPLCLGGPAAPSRQDYDHSFAQAVRFYRAVAERGAAAGVIVCAHPHSHYGSLVESAAEYDALLAATEDAGLMFNPDAGHIVRGGQDLMDCLRRHRSRIAHVHIKDVDAAGKWQPLGCGKIPWREVLDFLRDTGYTGWIVAEEESDAAHADQAAAILANRAYLRRLNLQ